MAPAAWAAEMRCCSACGVGICASTVASVARCAAVTTIAGQPPSVSVMLAILQAATSGNRASMLSATMRPVSAMTVPAARVSPVNAARAYAASRAMVWCLPGHALSREADFIPF